VARGPLGDNGNASDDSVQKTQNGGCFHWRVGGMVLLLT
jgi:hypothetical protein